MIRRPCILLKLRDPNGSLQQTAEYSGKFRFMNIVKGYSRGRQLSLTLASAQSIESTGHEMLIPQSLGQREITISWKQFAEPLKIIFPNKYSLSLEMIQKEWNPFNNFFCLISLVFLAHMACLFALRVQIQARRPPIAIASRPKVIEAIGLQYASMQQTTRARESIGRTAFSKTSLADEESAILKKWKFQTNRKITKTSNESFKSPSASESHHLLSSQLTARLSAKKRLVHMCLASLQNSHGRQRALSASFLIDTRGMIQNISFEGANDSNYRDFAQCLRDTLGQFTTLKLAQAISIRETLIFD